MNLEPAETVPRSRRLASAPLAVLVARPKIKVGLPDVFQVVDTSMVFVAKEPVKLSPLKTAFGKVSAPDTVPPALGRLPLAVPVSAPTKVVLVTLVRPVMVEGSEIVGEVVPVTVI